MDISLALVPVCGLEPTIDDLYGFATRGTGLVRLFLRGGDAARGSVIPMAERIQRTVIHAMNLARVV